MIWMSKEVMVQQHDKRTRTSGTSAGHMNAERITSGLGYSASDCTVNFRGGRCNVEQFRATRDQRLKHFVRAIEPLVDK